jgi:D-beta-D-heptose 7-phosphate kinase/D-beta-D-heptose 1-phosphate adenosyltransferase
MTIIALSGGFDPIHRGHVDMIEEAAQHGRIHIYLNTDEWLKKKKGYIFMPWEDRARILMAMKGVELVFPAEDKDGTVCETIRKFKPDIFGNGGDRGPKNTPELKLCNDLRIKTLFGLGGKKVQSSSSLVKKAREND